MQKIYNHASGTFINVYKVKLDHTTPFEARGIYSG
jgi:hypothetical protein